MDTFDPNRKDLVSLSEIHRSVLFCFFSFFWRNCQALLFSYTQKRLHFVYREVHHLLVLLPILIAFILT